MLAIDVADARGKILAIAAVMSPSKIFRAVTPKALVFDVASPKFDRGQDSRDLVSSRLHGRREMVSSEPGRLEGAAPTGRNRNYP